MDLGLVEAKPPPLPCSSIDSADKFKIQNKSKPIRKTIPAICESSEKLDKSRKEASLRLIDPAKQPYIEWSQTDTTVKMAIKAPDVKDYSLVVGSRYVKFW